MGVTLVTMDGEVLEIGGAHLDAPGYDLLGLICGSEGQLGIVTEAVLRDPAQARGGAADPRRLSTRTRLPAPACPDIIRAGILPVAIEFMDRPCIRAVEDFAGAGYPDVEALLIIEVEGSADEIDDQLGRVAEIARRHDPVELRESSGPAESALIWKGRKSGVRRDGADQRLHVPRRHDPGQPVAPCAGTDR